MKSTIFSILPIAGLAAAHSSACPAQQTITTTEYETVYATATAASVADVADITSSKSKCSRPTVTATTHEKVYVTVTPGYGSMTSSKPKSTSTVDVYTTVTVRPTASVCVNTPSSASFMSAAPSSSSMAPAPTASKSSSSAAYATSATAEAVYSTSVTAEAVHSTSAYVAPTSSPAASRVVSSSVSASTVVSTAPAATSSTVPTGKSNNGEATFYGGNVDGGMCSFTGYTIPNGLFGVALTSSDWDSGNACGTCVSVTGPSGNKITAMVVDQCPNCGPHHLDLFPDAFAKLAEPSKGVINVSWEVVPCGITTPIVLKNKSGTSKYWFSMQVMNSNVEVKSLEVSTDGGNTWKATQRKDYNYFENPAGFGTDSVDVKVTGTSGSPIIVKNVSIASGTTKTGSSNFA